MRWLVATLVLLGVLAAAAIEPPQPAPAPAKTEPAQQEPPEPVPARADETPAEQKPGDEATPAADAAPEEEEEELPPLPPDTVPSGPPPARFNPTEKVRADFPVSFPIDI